MNKKVMTIIIVIAIVALCVLALVYAPGIMETIASMHKIPQH